PDARVNGKLLIPYSGDPVAPQIEREILDTQITPVDLQPEPIIGNPISNLLFEGYHDGVGSNYFIRGFMNRVLKGLDEDDYSYTVSNFPTVSGDLDYIFAQSGECALDLYGNAVFFEYIDELSKNINFRLDPSVQNSKSAILASAESLNIDSTDLEDCVDSKKHLPEVLDDIRRGRSKGVFADAIFVNGEYIQIVPTTIATEEVIQSLHMVVREKLGKIKTRDLQSEPKLGAGSKVVEIYLGNNDIASANGWKVLREVLPSLQDVSIEFRNLPFVHLDNNYYGAQVGECVLDDSNDETFFRYLDALYSDTSSLGTGGVDEGEASGGRAALVAESVGLELDDIIDCIEDGVFLSEVLDDIRVSQVNNIISTPAYVVGGKVLEGVPSAADLLSFIQSSLPSTSSAVRSFPLSVTGSSISGTCSNGCFYDSYCIPAGFRVTQDNVGSYCISSGSLNQQLATGDSCNNNYECATNFCSNSICAEYREAKISFFEKLALFFRKIF
ncbi:MAG: thioredoxin domain-containing protein, partial [Nanoarchaeota archaeon]